MKSPSTTLLISSMRTDGAQFLGLLAVVAGPFLHHTACNLIRWLGRTPPEWMLGLYTVLAIAAPCVAALWLAELPAWHHGSRFRSVLGCLLPGALAGVAIQTDWACATPGWHVLDFATTVVLLGWLAREVLRHIGAPRRVWLCLWPTIWFSSLAPAAA